jgi:hypothetical protein
MILPAMILPWACWGADPQRVFADAVAVWHFGDLNSADVKSPLKLHGAAKVGVERKGVWSNNSSVALDVHDSPLGINDSPQ